MYMYVAQWEVHDDKGQDKQERKKRSRKTFSTRTKGLEIPQKPDGWILKASMGFSDCKLYSLGGFQRDQVGRCMYVTGGYLSLSQMDQV